VGLFSRRPVAPLPDRQDLVEALAALDPRDAQRIRSRRHLVEMCASIPTTSRVLAVLHAITDWPADDGLLYVTTGEVVFLTGHSGVSTIPAAGLVGAEIPFTGTLRLLHHPTTPGSHISFRHDRTARRPGEPEGLDLTVTARTSSLRFFCEQALGVALAR
jgi:hypothetical protein